MKIILCNNSDIKEQILKKWFENNLKINIEIEKVYIENNLLPPQPIGNDIESISLNKINFVKDKNTNPNLKYIVSMDNFIDIMEDKIKYYIYISVYTYDKNEYITKKSEGIDLDIEIMNDYPNFLSIIKDLKNSYLTTKEKYIFNGCQDKISELIHKYYPNIPKNNWIKVMKKNKLNQFSLLFDEVFK